MEKMLSLLQQFLVCEKEYLSAYYGEANTEIYEEQRSRYIAYFEKDLLPARRLLHPDNAWFESQKQNRERVEERNVFMYGIFNLEGRKTFAFYLSKPDKQLLMQYDELLFAPETDTKLKFISSYLWNYPENRDTTYKEEEQWDWHGGIQFSSWPHLSPVQKLKAPDNKTQLYYYNLYKS